MKRCGNPNSPRLPRCARSDEKFVIVCFTASVVFGLDPETHLSQWIPVFTGMTKMRLCKKWKRCGNPNSPRLPRCARSDEKFVIVCFTASVVFGLDPETHLSQWIPVFTGMTKIRLCEE
jgi:peroxiredoxin family protein